MAFEQVFGNIDFQAPTRARQAEAAQFQQLLGNAIQAQREQKRYEDMKEMERQKQEREASQNYELRYQNEVMKAAQNMPYDESVIRGWESMQKQTMNPFTGEVFQPARALDSLGFVAERAGGGRPAGAGVGQVPEFGNNTVVPQEGSLEALMGGMAAPADQNFYDAIPPLSINDLEGSANVPYNPPTSVISDGINPPQIKAAGQLSKTRAGQKAEMEANLQLQRAIAEKQAGAAIEQRGDATAKITPINNIIDLLEGIDQDVLKKAPSGALQGVGAKVAGAAGFPTEGTIAQSNLEVDLPMVFSQVKSLVRGAGEGTFTDADAKAIEGINFNANDPYLVKKEKLNRMLKVMKRAKGNIEGQPGGATVPQTQDAIDYREFFK